MLCSLGITLCEKVPDILIRHAIHRHLQQVFILGVPLDVLITVCGHLCVNRLFCLTT